MNNSPYSLSKSSFLKFEQCPKAFFLYKNHPYLRDKISKDKQLTFNRGHVIGGFAQELFPGGTDVSLVTKNVLEAYELTKELISKKSKTIYEATFIFDKTLIMIDILNLENCSYHAYEVKSSLKVSEVYLMDACLQYFVLKNSIENLEDFFLVTINGDYVFDEIAEPKKLFKKRSIKSQAEKNFGYFQDKIFQAQLTLEQNIIPNIPIGKQCFKPYVCDFFGTCWKGTENEKSIFNLPLVNKEQLFEWHNAGVSEIKQIDENTIESSALLKIKKAFESDTPVINQKTITETLSCIQFPLAAIDMEIWSPAIPALQGTRPFQQIPFLFCVYNNTEQSFYLTEHASDQRRAFAQELISQTKKYNTLLVYDKTMEEQAINGLILLFADLEKELTEVKTKFLDLFELIKNLHYYEPSFKNNFSLKTVAEALKLNVSFDKIKSGLEAMNYFEGMRQLQNEVEKQLVKEDLTEYCGNDAKGTYLLYEFFTKIVK